MHVMEYQGTERSVGSVRSHRMRIWKNTWGGGGGGRLVVPQEERGAQARTAKVPFQLCRLLAVREPLLPSGHSPGEDTARLAHQALQPLGQCLLRWVRGKRLMPEQCH